MAKKRVARGLDAQRQDQRALARRIVRRVVAAADPKAAVDAVAALLAEHNCLGAFVDLRYLDEGRDR